MFDFIRTHKKIMQILLIILIFPSFVLFGIDGYKQFNEKGEAVAIVDGVEISKDEWEQAHKVEVERMRTSMPNVDVSMFDTPVMRYGVLERMIQSRVLESSVKKLHLQVSDQKVAQAISDLEQLASIKKPNGSMDIDQYKQILAAQGMTPEMFESRMRSDLSVRQVVNGVTQSSVTFPSQFQVSLNALAQQREIQVAIFSASDYLDKAQPNEEEIQAFYKTKSDDYKSIETADIEYVVLSLEAIEKTISVTEGEIKAYFDQNQANLASKEERRASHILISVTKDASASEKAKAQDKAKSLLETLRKNPDQFSDLAQKNSQDAGSAAKGGDLDFFAKGAMVKPFEEMAFKLKKGEISDLVETEFGFHIIRLTDIKTPAAANFTLVKSSLEADLKKELARKKFAEIADQFSNLVYEQSDSFKPVVQKFKLEIHKADGVTREINAGGKVVWADPKLLQRIFSQESIDKKRNTEAVETAPNQLVSARIIQYRPSVTLPLEDVKNQVVQALLSQKALELAKKEGESKLELWRSQPDVAQFQVPVVISRDQTQKLPSNLVERAMRADAKKLPIVEGVDLGSRGFGIVKINKLIDSTNDKPTVESSERFTKAWATAENLAYFAMLKERLKVKVKVQPPADNRIMK